jgi:hypothetical protein
MKLPFLLAMLVMATSGADAAPTDMPSKRDVVAFHASVRVEVDAAGKPVKVEAPQDLPEAIGNFIEKRVASWQYQPGKIEGVAQAATTYVAVNACAVPVAEGYRLGVDFDGNGPRVAGDQRLSPPEYPAFARRTGTEAEFKLILGIQTDGRAVIDEIEKAEISGGGGRRTGSNEFELELRRWVKTLHFDPEMVAGKPVREQVGVPVSFVIDPRADRQALEETLQAKAKASRECQLAAGANDMKPVALLPAVAVIPTPAG